MKTTGTVLAAADGKATVRVFRESPCAACNGCVGGACHAEFAFDSDPVGITVAARDPIGVHMGDVVCADVCGTGVDVIATKTVE